MTTSIDQPVRSTPTEYMERPQSLEEALLVIERQQQEIQILNEQLRHDGLSGLLNKTAWHAEVDKRIEDKKPFGVILLDLDKFKQVNDTFGHPIGDAVLSDVGNLLRDGFQRESDTLAFLPQEDEDPITRGRIGGDEFALTIDLSEVDGRSSHDVNEKMDQVKAHLEQVWDEFISMRPDFAKIGLGMSMGSIVWDPENPISAPALYHEVDVAMYNKKRSKVSRFARLKKILGAKALKARFSKSNSL